MITLPPPLEVEVESRDEMRRRDLQGYRALASASPADDIRGLDVEFGIRASLDDFER